MKPEIAAMVEEEGSAARGTGRAGGTRDKRRRLMPGEVVHLRSPKDAHRSRCGVWTRATLFDAYKVTCKRMPGHHPIPCRASG